MKRNAIILAVLAIVVAAMLYSGRFFQRRPAGAGGTALYGSAEQVRGRQAPDFELQDLDGKTVKLSDLRGKAVLVNFWATWCGPCEVEIPWFVDLQQRYGSQGLQIVGVAMDDAGKDAIAKFAREHNVNYIILLGKNETADAYGGVQGLPTTFYLDRQGKVHEFHAGLSDRKEIEENIKEIVASSAAGVAPSGTVANRNSSLHASPGVNR